MHQPPGCAFAPRCAQREAICDSAEPQLETAAPGHATRCVRWREVSGKSALPTVPSHEIPVAEEPARDAILEVAGLVKHFPTAASSFGRSDRVVRAVEGVDLTVRRGEVLSLVGESGSGKTTVGRCILRLTEPTAGAIRFDGRDVLAMRSKEMVSLRRHMQVVFQDPFSSLNPKLTIGSTLAEPLRAHGLLSGRALKERVAELLTMVGLDPAHAVRYPANFSGGQRQRIAIARALALGPEFIVADEAVSALDVSIRAQITNLLQDLKQQLSLTLLFIAHDLALVRQISDRVVILYLGRIMEEGPVEAVFSSPRHPYTEALLSSIPVPDPDSKRERIVLKGDIPSPVAPPSGCVFRTRCPMATEECAKTVPARVTVGPDHTAACLYAG
jgi:peptide/nickel transport system ATP-binding protein